MNPFYKKYSNTRNKRNTRNVFITVNNYSDSDNESISDTCNFDKSHSYYLPYRIDSHFIKLKICHDEYDSHVYDSPSDLIKGVD